MDFSRFLHLMYNVQTKKNIFVKPKGEETTFTLTMPW